MRYWVSILSFFILGCQLIDPIVVPIDRTARDINASSTIYKDDQTHTKMGFESSGLIWKKEF